MTKKTALYDEHIRLGARMVDFSGWEMPVMYGSIMEEHRAVRERAGLFDISHMGEVVLRGKGSGPLLRRLIPTKLDKLMPGRAMYSCFCSDRGGVIDDLFVYMFSAEEYFLVINASNIEKDLDWIKANAAGDVEIIDRSPEMAKIDLQGPDSPDILCRVFGRPDLRTLQRFSFLEGNFGDFPCIISNSGYTGERGYELYIGNDGAAGLWRALLNDGRALPAGLGARDGLRIEACYSLYGHELSEEISPVEAGLSWLLSSTDDFIGRGPLTEQKRNGAPREMICFELHGRGVPRQGYRVRRDGGDIGEVTSGAHSPVFDRGIGMALVRTGSASPGDEVEIIIRDKPAAARVAKRPLYSYRD